ncbi:MAG: hypothetical protein NT166_17120 [Candidatus Aminicenantes bacterium]|nr:hypothetical protein [Candidatus Aminicenantes bacterium]
MMLKKTLVLLVVLLILLFSLLNAVPSFPFQEIEDEKDVEQLIDKAGYCYGILEDYPRALKYLNRALELAAVPYVKADVLIKTAYVYFMMGKDASVYSGYIKAALQLDGSLELDRLYYRERFITIFTTIKNEPQVTAREIETRLLQSARKKKGAGSRFFVMVDAGYMLSFDSNYKRIYGSGAIFPRVKAGFKIARNFYMWAGYSVLKGKGTIPEIETDADSAQNFLALGFKYTRDFTGKWGYKLEASTVRVSYSEKALDAEVKDSISGFGLEVGLTYPLGKRLFTEFYTGIQYASDLVFNKKVLLGGFSAGLGLGMKF